MMWFLFVYTLSGGLSSVEYTYSKQHCFYKKTAIERELKYHLKPQCVIYASNDLPQGSRPDADTIRRAKNEWEAIQRKR